MALFLRHFSLFLGVRRIKAFSLICTVMMGGVFLEGCSNSSPTYYTLMQQDGATYSTSLGSIQTVKVLEPSVTAQLDRDTVVLSSQSYRMMMDTKAAWSEPLPALIGHTLAHNIAQRLPGRVVFSQNDSVSATPHVNVSLSINRFDIDASHHVVVDGILSIKNTNTTLSSGEVKSIPVHWVSSQSVRYAAKPLAESLSQGVGVIADQAAHILSTIPR